jgi:hypothetical protein
MLVESNSSYEVNPNPRKTLLKIKATEESVVQVVGVVEGTNSNMNRLGAVTVKFTGKDKKLIISFVCLATSNSYKIEYDLPVPVTQDFTFTTDKEGILLLPSAEYKMVIDPRGLINFHMMRDDQIKLDLYVSRQRVQAAGRV